MSRPLEDQIRDLEKRVADLEAEKRLLDVLRRLAPPSPCPAPAPVPYWGPRPTWIAPLHPPPMRFPGRAEVWC